MPHLLSVNAYHYVRGGSDVVYFEHAKLFEAHGWQNSFSSMHHPANEPCEDSCYFAEEIDYHLPASKLRKIIHAQRIIWSREARAKLAAQLDTRRIDVAHVHNIYHHQSPSILAELKSRGIPVVLTAHDLKLACPNNRMMNHTGICERCKGGRVWNTARYRCVQESLAASALITLESAIHKALDLWNRNLDRIVTPSAFYRAKLIEWGWEADKIVHIPNFIANVAPPTPTISGDYLLYFGRLAPEKGLHTLIRAAAATRVPVMIAGIGPEEMVLQTLAAETGAPVTFAGFLSGERLWQVIARARAVVLPSEWYENGPMSIIEAFARGKPLIGAAIGGIPELLEGGATGWSFVSGSVDDLGRALVEAMAAQPTALAAKSRAAMDLVRREFSQEAYFHRMHTLYADLM